MGEPERKTPNREAGETAYRTLKRGDCKEGTVPICLAQTNVYRIAKKPAGSSPARDGTQPEGSRGTDSVMCKSLLKFKIIF